MEKPLVLTENTPIEEYSRLYSQEPGFVFKIEGDYEAVMQRIEAHVPNELAEFKVYPINPGTKLFMLTGPDHCVVTKRELK